jgi:hypothetical protein
MVMVAARMLLVASLALCVLVGAGCQPKPATLSHVTGKVMLKGAPLHTGLIVFSPDTSRGESGRLAVSRIEADGTYTLKTDDKPGAANGWYRIAIVSIANASSNYDSAPVSYLDVKYRDPTLSQLQCEVKPNRDNHLDFNLD